MQNNSKKNKKNQMKSDLVSIIVRTKNRRELLQRALDSIYSQTYPNIEIIVVNDAGCEVSDLINYYRNLKPDLNIKRSIVYIKNTRTLYRSSSANVGIKAAKGKYIGFLDDDDYYFSEHIAKHVESQKKSKSPISISIAVESIEKEKNGKLTSEEKTFIFPKEINKIYLFFFENYFPFNTIIFQKEITKKIGFLDEKRFVLEDWDFIIRMFLNYKPILIEDVTCEYSTRNNMSNIRNNFEYQEVWKKNFIETINKYKKVYKGSEVTIPISEISDFLASHSIEWYQTSVQWTLFRDSFAYKLFYSKSYNKIKKIARLFGFTRR